ncbi:MAG: VWA domain-containing protein [Deltaproteobacteria bacterium]|nr:VWA domain-containing protein [Deltaproteobacteria bacterium]
MAPRSRGVGAAFVLAGLLAAACSPSDDDTTVGDVRPRDDGGGGETALDDGTPPVDAPDVVEPDDAVGRDLADYAFDMVCGTEDLPLEFAVSSDVLIVLDRSGSMAFTLNALKTAVNRIVDASDDRIWFGLMPFPSTVPPNACASMGIVGECAAPATLHVPPGPLAAPEIAGVLSGIGICGSTPTSATLVNARTCLAATATGHTKYVLLVTDGVPNCNSSLDWTTCTCLATEEPYCTDRPEACLDDGASYAALDGLLGDGVQTYVMALGRWLGGDREVLDTMAVHGGTEHFYPAEDTAAILSTFEAIMGTIVVSCVFDLHPGPETDPTQVNLYVGEELVPRDPSHGAGWDYLDDDTVEFYGAACDTILAGDVGAVHAAYGCPTILI